MYLVVVIVEYEAGDAAITDQYVMSKVRAATAVTDGLQHSYVEVDAHCINFCLYVQAIDRACALNRVEQLCRRTMATIARPGEWNLEIKTIS